jgi:hypothetical protein
MDSGRRSEWAAIAAMVALPVAAAVIYLIESAADDSPPEVCERYDYSPGCLEYEPDPITGG